MLNADYTFVNERLAQHYGIPNVYGPRFRRVTLNDEARRGLLGQGSVLTVTSYATRTSPVLRGKWILTNILGTPPPAPPPNVPALKENNEGGKVLSVRERLEEHRKSPACASCHKIMDPLGFALENFDAIGQWRAKSEDGAPIDASGVLLDGSKVDGPTTLRAALLSRPDVFVSTLTEKLMTYALGRGVDYNDMPAIRAIVARAAADHYRFSDLVAGIVKSPPFRMKIKTAPDAASPAVKTAMLALNEETSMTIVTKKHLSRRTMLQGLGVAISLPLLDSMIPALTAQTKTAANVVPRLGCIYVPHGAVMDKWTPIGTGADFEFGPILSALQRHRENVIVVSNLSHHMAEALGDGGADHSRATATWLNGTHAKKTEGEDVRAGTTIDQMAAAKIGQSTRFPSLELATEDMTGLIGACDVGYSCAYMNTISWSNAHHAAADGDQSARGVRAAVRRRRHACPSAWRAWTKTRASWIRSPDPCRACKRVWARAIALA